MGVNLSNIKISRRGARLTITSLALAAALAIAGVFGTRLEGSASAQQQSLPSPQDLSRTFINVAKQVKPAVVNIDVVEKAKRENVQLPEGFPQIPGFGDAQPRRQRGTGSGVIISSDGFILTNNHVAGDAEQMKVKLADGREFRAKLVGKDSETDLALIKIDAAGLPYARLGDSDKLEQGEWVVTLGSPFGLQQTMTAGIVSATGRDLPIQGGQFTNFIQTDAKINPGNSGGPLVNMNGEVIGINTLIYSRSGGSEGVGFAIPSNLVGKVYAELRKSGKVTRAYLGLYPTEVTPSLARNARFTGEGGALVNDLSGDDSPAAKAGLRSGDIITEVDGTRISSPKQLVEIVSGLPVGRTIDVKYLRDGRMQTARVTLGERPPAEAAAAKPDADDEGENPGKLGVSVTNVTPQIARQLKLRVGTGVVVASVQPDGPADDAGIQQGDVIHRVNQTPVTNRQDLASALAATGGNKEVVLQVESGGRLRFVTVTLE